MTLEEILAAVAPLYERLSHQERELAELKQRVVALEAKTPLDYHGVWEQGRRYCRGAAVTDRGALWICEHASDHRPGDGPENGWKLAVKSHNGAPAPPRRIATEPRGNGLGQVQPTRPRAR
jgi:hypothetical protein